MSGVGTNGGVRATPPSSLAALSASRGTDAAAAGEPPRPVDASQRHLLWWRDGRGSDRRIRSAVGPGIGEGEMSTVHLIIHSGALFKQHLKRWLVTSIDTDQWMLVLLAMSCGYIEPQGSNAVQVTVKRIVSGGPRYILVNRVYGAIVTQRDGSESAWPPDGQ